MARLPKPPKPHLLIDGDVVAFIAAAAVQSNVMDTFGWMQPIACAAAGEAVVENMIFTFVQAFDAASFEVILTDPVENWRRQVDPTYKTNRVGARPLLLGHLKDYLTAKHDAYFWPGLEADDTLSIRMTDPGYHGGDKLICVGRDKDFKTIPGFHHSIKQDVGPSGQPLVREVSPWEADRFHLIQALAGDRVDGFYGCPGVGMDRAASIIDNPVRLVPQEGVITRGKNKGESVTKWVAEPTQDLWACIVSHYRKAGLGEPEALVTARLARLLRHGEYNRETEEVTLWVPEMIRGL